MSIASSFPTIKPSLLLDFANVGALDPRITFTRASTATFYDGVTTAKAEENLLSYSQKFNEPTAWSKTNITVTDDTGDTTAPDGTSTASKIIATATTAQHYNQRAVVVQIPVTSGQVYSLSVFAKAGTETVVQLTAANATAFGINAYANFDLSAGTIGTIGSAVSNQSIVSVGNGWYRISFTCSATANDSFGSFIVSFTNNNSSAGRVPNFTAAGTEAFYVWGAQLEQRSSVTAYTPTTTQPITNYIPVLQTAAANVARFDHNPTTGEALGLLVEEQRTNLVLYSEQFDNAAWTKANLITTVNTVVAPDGTLTGNKIFENTANAQHLTLEMISVSNVSYTASVYVKSAGWTTFSIQLGGGGPRGDFNLSTVSASLALGASSASITSVGNGWYRCSVVGTPSAGTMPLYMYKTSASYTGDGYSGIYVWGAQFEAGAFPTSYTATTSAQVTRSADDASMTGTNFSSWFNNAEGTVYAEAAVTSIVGPFGLWAVGDASLGFSTRNSIYSLSSTGTGLWAISQAVNAVAQLNPNAVTGSFVANIPRKIAFAFKTDDTVGASNGAIGTVDTACLVPVSSSLSIGSLNSGWANGGNYLNGHISKLAFYHSRLTNAQLQALTS